MKSMNAFMQYNSFLAESMTDAEIGITVYNVKTDRNNNILSWEAGLTIDGKTVNSSSARDLAKNAIRRMGKLEKLLSVPLTPNYLNIKDGEVITYVEVEKNDVSGQFFITIAGNKMILPSDIATLII